MTNMRKIAISKQFDAANDYDNAARIQKKSATQLAHIIASQYISCRPYSILELGCGTGFLSTELLTLFPDTTLCATDLSKAMIARTKKRLNHHNNVVYHCMDGEEPFIDWPSLPKPPFDLITSNLCWQWFTNRPQALHRLTALLAPGGRLIVSTLLENSLDEWRESCIKTNTLCGVPHYPSLNQLESEWSPNGVGSWSETIITDPVSSARSFLNELRKIGASLPRTDHSPIRSNALRHAMKWFDTHHCTINYHIGFGSFKKEQS